MSLKEALLKHKQQLDEIKRESIEKQQAEKLQMMLAQQQRILDESDKPKQTVKIKKEVVDYSLFDNTSLLTGGIFVYKCIIDGKERNIRISLTCKGNDAVLKYHCLIANGERFSCNVRSYTEAKIVIDGIFGRGQYRPSASRV